MQETAFDGCNLQIVHKPFYKNAVEARIYSVCVGFKSVNCSYIDHCNWNPQFYDMSAPELSSNMTYVLVDPCN